ncbi:hypothetical protein [Neptunomonas antarctica]|uniref:Uncharacterized membrane protein n=1 Tax=Neptunomonas antarctica TaxID=619304 RepID=A0A1N7IT58_9GAMM|nr:hypothetical protein [Neptunomonas antarctica]SIS40272.1 Uncharacterized membrane protein [Neptunomonas antarctica]
MKTFFRIIIILLSVCYPFIVYWGLQHYDAGLLLPVILCLLGAKLLAGGSQRPERYVIAFTLVGIVVIALAWEKQIGLKFYPVMMNLGFFTLFFSSLWSTQSIVERLARLKEPDLPAEGVAYTRKVTAVWSAFFLFNGTLAAITALWTSDEVWMLYNGFIAYLLIGTLAGAEWLIRQGVRRGR